MQPTHRIRQKWAIFFCIMLSVFFTVPSISLILLSISFTALADDVKELSGISIIGNKEAPKSLYIVPWKNSEVGVETSLASGLLDDSNKLIDKDVFLRELDFYEISEAKQSN